MISRLLILMAMSGMFLSVHSRPVLAQIDIGQVIDRVNDAAAGEQNGNVAPQPDASTLAGDNAPADGTTNAAGSATSEGTAASSAPENTQANPEAAVEGTPQSGVTPETAQAQTTQKAGLLPQGLTSVVFTYWEYTAILDAKRSRRSSGVQRGVTEDELNRALQDQKTADERPVPPPEEREITLGGIVFTNTKDWTIWLNGQRVTPDALPEEIIDLRVTRHYIDVKWLDTYTQKLYPIRLRAHQRFNLDTRIFLPG